MERKDLITYIKEVFSDYISEVDEKSSDPIFVLKRDSFKKSLKELKEHEDLCFDYLMNLTAVDYPADRLELVIHLYSMDKNHRICVKTILDRENPLIPSVTDLWRGAEWHERETYDFFGINFEGNPDLRRILLPEDFSGHPLRKDFTCAEIIPSPDSKDMMKPRDKS